MHHHLSLEGFFLDASVITIGSFDGVHIGHQKIIQHVVQYAKAKEIPSVVITFFPHPAMVLRNLNEPFYLTFPEERAAILFKLGIDHVVTLNFTKSLRDYSPTKFLAWVKDHLAFQHLVVGEDFALGRDREGNAQSLKSLGIGMDYTTEIVSPATDEENQKISSSSIRKLIQTGNIQKAKAHLSREFILNSCTLEQDTAISPEPSTSIYLFSSQPMFMLPGPGIYAGALVGNQQRSPALIEIPNLKDSLQPFPDQYQGKAILLDHQKENWGQEKTDIVLYSQIRAWSPWVSQQQMDKQIENDFHALKEVIDSHA